MDSWVRQAEADRVLEYAKLYVNEVRSAFTSANAHEFVHPIASSTWNQTRRSPKRASIKKGSFLGCMLNCRSVVLD